MGERRRSSIIGEPCLIRTCRDFRSKSVYRLPLSAVFLGGYSRLFSSCHPGCQCPQKTEIPPAVFTRFITYRVNAEWLPVLRKLVPLISPVRTHALSYRPENGALIVTPHRQVSSCRESSLISTRNTVLFLPSAPRDVFLSIELNILSCYITFRLHEN